MKRVCSEETRAKLSAAHMGIKPSAESLAKRSASMKGKFPKAARIALMSPDVIARRNESIRVSHQRPETKEKIAAASKRNFANKIYREKHRQAVRVGVKAYWANLSPEKKAAQLKNWLRAGHEASSEITVSSLERAVARELERLGEMFVPQQFIGPYRTDFFLPQRRLIIECDGAYWHSLPGAVEHDATRDAFHRGHGFEVARLSESEIRTDAAAAVTRILRPEFSIGGGARREVVG